MITLSLIFSLGLYIGMSLKNPRGFVNASAAGLIRGILLALIWPVGLIVAVNLSMRELDRGGK